jgi:hypothetical protein
MVAIEKLKTVKQRSTNVKVMLFQKESTKIVKKTKDFFPSILANGEIISPWGYVPMP